MAFFAMYSGNSSALLNVPYAIKLGVLNFMVLSCAYFFLSLAPTKVLFVRACKVNSFFRL